jgi:hypothetical protein
MMEALWGDAFKSPCGMKYIRRAIPGKGQEVLGHDDCPLYDAGGNTNCTAIHDYAHQVPQCMPTDTTIPTITTTAATTTAKTTKVTGSLKLASSKLNKGEVENGVKKALAQHMSVKESAITVTATKSRRLDSLQVERRLAGTWSVAFTVHVPESQAAAVTTKVNQIATDATSFNAALKTSLKSLGVSDTDATVSVTGFTASHMTTTPKKTTTAGLETSNAPKCHLTSLVFFVVALATRR